MLRWVTVLFLAGAMARQAGGEEIATMGSPEDKMELSVWKVPPGFMNDSKGLPVTFRSKENPSALHYDTKAYFESCGVPFPPGAVAIYNAQSSTILVRNTRDNLDLMDCILGGCRIGYGFGFLSCELQTFECNLGSQPRGGIGSTPTYADLRHLPPSEIKLIDQASTVLKSGHKTELADYCTRPLPDGQVPTPVGIREQLKSQGRFADEDVGILATIETVQGPDGVICDTNLSCRMKILSDQGGAVEFQFRNAFVTLNNQPVVIYSAPLPGPGGKTLVVVAKIQWIDCDGLTFDPQFPAASR